MPHLKIAIVGCGSRGRTYARLMAESPDKYQIVAGADPDPARLAFVKNLTGTEFQSYPSAEALLSRPTMADLAIVATQDADHVAPTLAALEKGYDVLVEKPVATNIADVETIDRRARDLGRKVLTCFVLRYTPFYRTVKEIVASGKLGKIISIRAFEGVEPWHQSHSFVRGHWSKTAGSTPMIVAKCCHDMDILSWLVDSPTKNIGSHGHLSFFKAENAPSGATPRCTDGCPHCDSCPYDAHRYLTDKKATWLPMVHPAGMNQTDEEILDWLKNSPWGRCVYLCDNDSVDHQTVNIEFENEVTATFTMTAFDDGRKLEIYGTEATLIGHTVSYRNPEERLTLTPHHSPESEEISIPHAEGGHGGGDSGLIADLHTLVTTSQETGLLQNALRGHRLAFAAENARLHP